MREITRDELAEIEDSVFNIIAQRLFVAGGDKLNSPDQSGGFKALAKLIVAQFVLGFAINAAYDTSKTVIHDMAGAGTAQAQATVEHDVEKKIADCLVEHGIAPKTARLLSEEIARHINEKISSLNK